VNILLHIKCTSCEKGYVGWTVFMTAGKGVEQELFFYIGYTYTRNVRLIKRFTKILL